MVTDSRERQRKEEVGGNAYTTNSYGYCHWRYKGYLPLMITGIPQEIINHIVVKYLTRKKYIKPYSPSVGFTSSAMD